ncbi:hypothetical protein EI546_01580 [Aequorivita sp. H23M31]|uniref:DUF4221 domain-containing protein n=1 Tax=Aequorivita ciconiae TaxID=2494375 RepID=A0A410FZQ2_9FLAO|nr:hypothetical protein [Aequorivita sp. H23M31]QAA80498.1 hypothetical protein EI546_01580 [Aequorivita sp. H23M31]
MRFSIVNKVFCALLFLILSSCHVDNLDDQNKNPKTDYSSFNYVLATEDASTADITRFFSFNLAGIDRNKTYDLIQDNGIFINSDPSTSSGHHSFKNFIFSMAKDKNGYSSTPGLFRLTLNTSNQIFIDSEIYIGKENLFPSRKLALVNDHLGFYYNEDSGGQTIQSFDPLTMTLKEELDLRPFIKSFRPDAAFEDEFGNNLVRTGSLVMDYKEDKLYVSVVFLEDPSFNLIAESEENFYLAVIDIPSFSFEKIIQYHGAKTVGFFVSENNSTVKDEAGNLYFCSWGWNQFNKHNPSKVFRIKAGETEFDPNWEIDIESLFGEGRIAQSIASYNNKLYLHISQEPYLFESSEEVETRNGLKLSYYEFDTNSPNSYTKLDIPSSNPSSRMNVFNIVDDKLFMAVPNAISPNFNGVYSIDRSGTIMKEMQIANKYRPTRFYKLGN